MMMYSFKKGRRGMLVMEDGTTKPHELSRDVAWVDDYLVVDYVRWYNATHNYATIPNYLGINETDPFEAAALRLAKEGYSVFEMPGRISGKRYGFAVVVGEMDSEMD